MTKSTQKEAPPKRLQLSGVWCVSRAEYQSKLASWGCMPKGLLYKIDDEDCVRRGSGSDQIADKQMPSGFCPQEPDAENGLWPYACTAVDHATPTFIKDGNLFASVPKHHAITDRQVASVPGANAFDLTSASAGDIIVGPVEMSLENPSACLCMRGTESMSAELELNLYGDGDIELAFEVSRDGGATWNTYNAAPVKLVGKAGDQDFRPYPYSRTLPFKIDPSGTHAVQIRFVVLTVNQPFGMGPGGEPSSVSGTIDLAGFFTTSET